MPDKVIRILNFDNSVTRQSRLLERYPAEITDLTRFASSSRLYTNKSLRDKICALIPTAGKSLVFTGSGDFHHISEILTGRINTQAALIVFDFHPDFDGLPPRFGCGSWVRQALANKNISQCVLLGMGSADLNGPALFTASLGLLSGGRLEIYPYRHRPSRVFLRNVPANPSVDRKKKFLSTNIIWSQLENRDLEGFALELIKRLKLSKAYISIDKDCLRSDHALTNWEEGMLSLDQLLTMLRVFRGNLEIIGSDITGEYSPVSFSAGSKAWISRLDHPRKPSASGASPEDILKVNQETNLAILGQLLA